MRANYQKPKPQNQTSPFPIIAIICLECAAIGAMLALISSLIGAILIKWGFIPMPYMLLGHMANFQNLIAYLSIITSLIGAFLGIISGYLSFHFNKNFWHDNYRWHGKDN